MDSTCFLIGLQVCFYSAMKHENDVYNMVGCLQVVRIYSFMKEIKVYIRALYIVFLFVKTENNNFIKEIKHALPAFIAWWKPCPVVVVVRQSLWELSSRWKPWLCLGFSRICCRILTNVRLGFYQAIKARRNCFISKNEQSWMYERNFKAWH